MIDGASHVICVLHMQSILSPPSWQILGWEAWLVSEKLGIKLQPEGFRLDTRRDILSAAIYRLLEYLRTPETQKQFFY